MYHGISGLSNKAGRKDRPHFLWAFSFKISQLDVCQLPTPRPIRHSRLTARRCPWGSPPVGENFLPTVRLVVTLLMSLVPVPGEPQGEVPGAEDAGKKQERDGARDRIGREGFSVINPAAPAIRSANGATLGSLSIGSRAPLPAAEIVWPCRRRQWTAA